MCIDDKKLCEELQPLTLPVTPLFTSYCNDAQKANTIQDEVLKAKIVEILNAAVPSKDYKKFLQNYGFLKSSEKEYYLSKALFYDSLNCIKLMDVFFNNSFENEKTVNSEKWPFACFLKTINDLQFNPILLLDLNGKYKYARDHYTLNVSNEQVIDRQIQHVLKECIKDAGFTVNSRVGAGYLGNASQGLESNLKISFKMFVQQLSLSHQVMATLTHENQQFICMLFMLKQFVIAGLNQFILYSLSVKIHFNQNISLVDLYFLYQLDADLVAYIFANVEKFKLLFQANIAFTTLSKLAQINIDVYNTFLIHADKLIALVQEDWVTVEDILIHIRKGEWFEQCWNYYLNYSDNLIQLKKAGIPSSILFGNDFINIEDSDEMISVLTMPQTFKRLLSNQHVRIELFFLDLSDPVMQDEDAFMLLCLKSKTFRIMIQQTDNLNVLLNIGFEFSELAIHDNPIDIQTLLECTESVKKLLEYPDITPKKLLSARLTKEALADLKPILECFSANISFHTLTHWPNMKLDVLLKHRVYLMMFKQSDFNLERLMNLSEVFPRHAMLILQYPNDYHAKWWFKQKVELFKVGFLNNKYHVVFDLDECVVSGVRFKKGHVLKFIEKELYIEFKAADTTGYVIHPGFIELLKLLYQHGIRFSFFSAGTFTRNKILVKALLIKAFDEKLYDEIKLTCMIKSKEDIKNEPYKNLNHVLTAGGNIQQIAFMDDNINNKHPHQEDNFVHILSVRSICFEKILNPDNPALTELPLFEAIQSANQIFYMTGLLWDAIQLAENESYTLSESLALLKQNSNIRECQTYYQKGVNLLKETINPTLDLVEKQKIFSKDYQLSKCCQMVNRIAMRK